MLTEASQLRLASDATYQSLGPGEDTVILALRSGYLYTCNETSEAFLGALDGKRTLGQVVDRLLEEFDVPRETLARDLTDLAEKLIAEQIIESA